METVRLKRTWHKTCPANHVPLIFDGGYHCLPISGGVNGLDGVGAVGWGVIFGAMLAGVALIFALR